LEKGLPVTGARLNGVAAIREIEMMCVLYEHKTIVHAAAIQREEEFKFVTFAPTWLRQILAKSCQVRGCAIT